AVFGNAAKAGHDAVIQRFGQFRDIADRSKGDAVARGIDAGQRRVERLDLQPVDGENRMAIIQKIMRQREACRSKPGNQHASPTARLDERIAQVERIPAREQAVDLESPGQPEDILKYPRLGLRNIDGLLLLIDAGLHAVIANAVPRRGAERIIHRDHRERADHASRRFQLMHLRDLLVERAAGERDAKHRLAETAVLLPETMRAGILLLMMAEDAVMHLVEGMGEIEAAIGQSKAFTVAPPFFGKVEHWD